MHHTTTILRGIAIISIGRCACGCGHSRYLGSKFEISVFEEIKCPLILEKNDFTVCRAAQLETDGELHQT